MVWPMPLPSQNPIISCLFKIQNGCTFLILAYPGCPGKEMVKKVFVFDEGCILYKIICDIFLV